MTFAMDSLTIRNLSQFRRYLDQKIRRFSSNVGN